MPQLQLPIFPAGATEINSRIAVQKEASTVWYLHGHLPVFQHEAEEVRIFRMFTSQMIAGGTVKPKEIVTTFGVPMITVKRYVKLNREQGPKGFYETNSWTGSNYCRTTTRCEFDNPCEFRTVTTTASRPSTGSVVPVSCPRILSGI